MNLDDIKTKIESKMSKSLSTGPFLDRMRVLEEDSRKSAAYCDPKFVPFYYWLGTLISPKSVCEIGFKQGLFSGCFFKGCKAARHFLAFQEKPEEFYSPSIGRGNVRDNFKGKIDICVGGVNDLADRMEARKWDLVILNDECGYDKMMFYLDTSWANMSLDGLIVTEYVGRNRAAGEAYSDFCKGKNRDRCVARTRYGTGLISR